VTESFGATSSVSEARGHQRRETTSGEHHDEVVAPLPQPANIKTQKPKKLPTNVLLMIKKQQATHDHC